MQRIYLSYFCLFAAVCCSLFIRSASAQSSGNPDYKAYQNYDFVPATKSCSRTISVPIKMANFLPIGSSRRGRQL